ALIKGEANVSADPVQVYYYQLDHLGTPQEITDPQGNTVWSVHYRAYGNVLKQEIEEVHSPLRFQGQYYDAETGLHYNRHRYYNPSTAAFLTLDPIGLAGGLNNYQYVPNPTGWVDPLGLAVRKGDGDCCGQGRKLSDAEMRALGKQRAQDYAHKVNSEWDAMKPAEGAKKPGAVDVIVTRDGQVFEGYSTRKGHPNYDSPLSHADPAVSDAYNNIDKNLQTRPTHGKCAEVSALSKAKAAGADLNGAVSISADVKLGSLKPACPSCLPALILLGVKDGAQNQ
ncbi:RHS repeat-associated core domain-containing protein, partial [Motilimonas sp. 1_MG-2023]|uniref:RHS repeat domain-containing protein n=1 Tax=Motilimonas sp. 1_MG-2023 TaxID=3062672 RepID=UPI0026E45EAC